jgi:hypothetical protein
VRHLIGKGLQLAGLAVTGYACLVAFGGEMKESAMFQYGFGGLAIFWIGAGIRRGGA